MVIKADLSDGSINLSTKMLEQSPGEMITDKAGVFARAIQLESAFGQGWMVR